ncbi:helix-turn-helix domain-containing protein [Bradyrhizobium sp. NP1]|uniref:helix-turn-helix domain-containing protein n=1 Tax=Bradyrhizobium sp. NP1 TaxID=3049772 RepID=UPI0025A636C8|nr:helix-turn-helix domain-containing protein [Bradyrhizobium sp. NP1]WJR76769.1 helix-turn-helix domain-containing protein [Bradyrhizobium sp. NP1]
MLQTNSNDVDEHCASLGHWRLSYDQLSAGAFRGGFTQLSLPRVEVFRETTSQQVRQCGRIGCSSFAIGLPWQSAGEINCNGVRIAEANIIGCLDADVDMCTPKGFELRGLVMEAALIKDLAATLNIELPRTLWHQLGVVETTTASVARLRHLLTMIYETILVTPSVFEDPAVCRTLEDSLLFEVASMLPTIRLREYGRSTAARKRTVELACELMLASGDRHISLLDVCKAVGASPRKLGYCFHEVLGTSPMHYWRAMRLNRVRRDLKRCTDRHSGVYDMAVRHGFWHFGQFSLDYKRHFSELPSETLRRARPA